MYSLLTDFAKERVFFMGVNKINTLQDELTVLVAKFLASRYQKKKNIPSSFVGKEIIIHVDLNTFFNSANIV